MVEQMTPKRRLLAAMRGQPLDRVPFSPYISTYLNAGKLRGTLPPDWADLDDSYALVRKLGGDPIYRVEREYHPVQVEHPSVDTRRWFAGREITEEELTDLRKNGRAEGQEILIRYETRAGLLTEKFRDSRNAHTIFRLKHMFKEYDDFAPLKAFLEDMSFVINYEAFNRRSAEVGEEMLALAVGPISSPLHEWFVRFAGYEVGAYALYDYPREVEEIFDIIHEKAVESFRLMARSDCPAVWIGENTNSDFESPDLYRKYNLRTMRAMSDALHEGAKISLVHMCGKLRALLPVFPETHMDVADSVTPASFGDTDPVEAWDHWKGAITLHGGISPEWTWAQSVSEGEIVSGMSRLFDNLRPTDRFIAANADDTPVNAMHERLRLISSLTLELGEKACRRMWG